MESRNKLFIFLASIAIIVFISGCIKGETLIYASLDKPFQLKISQSAFISSESLKVTFLNVTGDSRCPSDVKCIQRGIASIELEVIKRNGPPDTFIISDEDTYKYNSTINLGRYSVKLVSIDPYPETTRKIKPSDYIATLTVSEN